MFFLLFITVSEFEVTGAHFITASSERCLTQQGQNFMLVHCVDDFDPL